MSQTAVDFLQP